MKQIWHVHAVYLKMKENFVDKSLFTTENLKSIGLAGLLAIVLWLSFSGQVIWSWQYKDVQNQLSTMKEERDKWMKVALEGTRLSAVTAQMTGRMPSMSTVEMVKPGKIQTPEEAAAKLDKISEQIEPGMDRTPLTTRLQRETH